MQPFRPVETLTEGDSLFQAALITRCAYHQYIVNTVHLVSVQAKRQSGICKVLSFPFEPKKVELENVN